jgi:beta-phosphoglucomutase family hydrolase
MLKAVIFDMDGVLIDSEPFHLMVNKRIFEKLGINVSEEEYQNFIGTTHEYMWSKLKEKYRLPQKVAELVNMQLSGNIEFIKNENIGAIKGVIDLLSLIKEENIKIGIASSSPEEVIELVINKLGISDYFSAIVSGEGLKKGKPAPDIFLKTARFLDTEPSNCVVIEDSEKGVNAAKAAGMKCIGFRNQNTGGQDLSNADLIVDNYNSIKISTLRDLF